MKVKNILVSFLIFSLLLSYGCGSRDKKDIEGGELIKKQLMKELNDSMKDLKTMKKLNDSIKSKPDTITNKTTLTNGTIFFPSGANITNTTTLPSNITFNNT